MFLSNGTSFTPNIAWASGPGNWDWSRSDVTSGDYDNDGRTDFIIQYNYGNASTGVWFMKSTGTAVTPFLAWASGPGGWDWWRSVPAAGDFTGNGRTGLGVLYNYDNATSGAWILESNGSSVTPGLAWSSGYGNWDWNRSDLTSGDYNGDGRDDLGILYDYGNSVSGVWMLKSNGSSFTPSLGWSSG